jgi:broad specificity phosphatase PhoE
MSNHTSGPALRTGHLLVVRHGESEWNAAGRWQGQADPKLSERGKEQAVQAAGALTGLGIGRVISSDLRRARHTAEIIARELGLESPPVDRGLREIDVGEWSGLTRVEIELRWPNLLAAWSAGHLESTPGGETLSALRTRVTEAIRRVVSADGSGSGSQTILVVTHRRTISALEESVGARPVRPGHLAGRRFSFSGDSVEPAEPIDLLKDVARW